MARTHHKITQSLGHRRIAAQKAGGLRGAHGQSGHRATRIGGSQPASNPARRITGCDLATNDAAFNPRFGIKMAAGGLGQARGVDQAKVARIVKVGERGKRVMKAKVHIRHILADHPPRRITFAQHAQVFGPGRNQVFIRGRADKSKPIGPAAQKQNHKDRVAHMCL